jgi:hypothetical protein
MPARLFIPSMDHSEATQGAEDILESNNPVVEFLICRSRTQRFL